MPSEWQRHSAKYLKEALKKASRTFRGKKKGPTPAQAKRIRELQKRRDDANAQIRKLKGR